MWQDKKLVSKDVLVDGGKIIEIADKIVGHEGAEAVDLTGCMLFPGFYNSHGHFYREEGPILSDEEFKTFLEGGVTTVRDMGQACGASMDDYEKWVNSHKGDINYPEILWSGKFIATEKGYGAYHPDYGMKIGTIIETADDARAAVNMTLGHGAQGIKTASDPGRDPENPCEEMPEDMFRALCDEAKGKATWVAAHIVSSERLLRHARMGLTECAHIPNDHMSDEVIEELVALGTKISPTLSIYELVTKDTDDDFMDIALDNTYRFWKAGGKISAGTDFMFIAPPWQRLGIPIRELQLLNEAGIPVEDVIDVATIGSAELCGQNEFSGSIEVGKRANLVAIRGQAIDEKFEVFENVELVVHAV